MRSLAVKTSMMCWISAGPGSGRRLTAAGAGVTAAGALAGAPSTKTSAFAGGGGDLAGGVWAGSARASPKPAINANPVVAFAMSVYLSGSFYFTRGGTIIPFKQQLPPLGGLEVRKPCLWLTPALMLAPAAGVTQVVLINLVGPVTVETAPDAAIHLEVLVHAGGSDAAFARTLAGQLDFQTQQTGGQLRISGVYPLDHFRDYGYPNMKSILGIHGTDSNEYNGQKVFIRDVG